MSNKTQKNKKVQAKDKAITGKPGRIIGNAIDTADNVVRVAKGIYNIVRVLKNHPEWYTKAGGDKLIGVNLNDKQGVDYNAISGVNTSSASTQSAMPTVAAIRMAFTRPAGDYGGWSTGIQQLYSSIRAANAGRVNYDIGKLEAAICNIRLAQAMGAFLNRAYKATQTFTTASSDVPAHILRAMGLDEEDFVANAADLYMYAYRWNTWLNTNMPLSLPLFDRARWLMRNVFVDSDSLKPNIYVPTLNMIDTYDSTTGMGNKLLSYYYPAGSTGEFIAPVALEVTASPIRFESLIAVLDTFQKECNMNTELATIIGDCIKAFGVHAEAEFCDKDSKLDFVYDEDILTQFENASVLHYAYDTHAGIGVSHALNGTLYINSTLCSYTEGNALDGTEPSLSLRLQASEETTQPAQIIVDQLLARYGDSHMLNFHTDEISPGKLMSTTRLVVSDPYFIGPSGLFFKTFGTEVVGSVCVLSRLNETAGYMYTPIAGLIGGPGSSTNSIYVLANTAAAWGQFDYAPSYTPITRANDTYKLSSIGAQVCQWDVFTEVGSKQIKNYFSFGNQSLVTPDKRERQEYSRMKK